MWRRICIALNSRWLKNFLVVILFEFFFCCCCSCSFASKTLNELQVVENENKLWHGSAEKSAKCIEQSMWKTIAMHSKCPFSGYIRKRSCHFLCFFVLFFCEHCRVLSTELNRQFREKKNPHTHTHTCTHEEK